MVGSANAEYQPRQIMGVGLGLLAMGVISLIDYKWILNFYWRGSASVNSVNFQIVVQNSEADCRHAYMYE